MIESYVLYSKPTRPTGRTIARELGVTKFGMRDPEESVYCLIRWGSSRKLPSQPTVEINPAASVRRCSDKIATFEVLQNAGVSVPPWSRDIADLKRQCGSRVPGDTFLARRNFLTNGRGIVPFTWNDPVPPADFYSMYLPPTREYRIHVANGQVIRIQGKYCDFPDQAVSNQYVRNHGTGWRYRTPRQDLKPNRKQAAVNAISAMGLDFGAVDMMVQSDKGAFYVFEVNSGPACSPLTARCYISNIAAMVRDRTQGSIKLAPTIWEGRGTDDLEDNVSAESYLGGEDASQGG